MIKIEDYMIKDLKLGGTDLLVYASLLSYMDKGFCNMTQNQIAADVGLSVRTVARSILKLKNQNIIDVKTYRDGYQKRNCILIKDDIALMNNCDELKLILEMWEQCIGVKESLTVDVYKAWRAYVYNSKDDYFVKMEIAIDRYMKILKDLNYYKSYIYSIKKFFDYKFADYLDKGIEWQEYQRFKSKQAPSFTSSDRPFQESESISDLDLGNVQM